MNRRKFILSLMVCFSMPTTKVNIPSSKCNWLLETESTHDF